MFVFRTQNLKQLPLRTKIGLFLAIALGITLLFLFGITFLVIALIGGLITMFANLFRGSRPQSRRMDNPFPPRRPPFQRPRSRRKLDDDDDVIDV
jgi:predicted lipid-binding transport protein (Tim44 family)